MLHLSLTHPSLAHLAFNASGMLSTVCAVCAVCVQASLVSDSLCVCAVGVLPESISALFSAVLLKLAFERGRLARQGCCP